VTFRIKNYQQSVLPFVPRKRTTEYQRETRRAASARETGARNEERSARVRGVS
jgi:hypothetical protein